MLGLAPRVRSLEDAFLALTGARGMTALLHAELLKLRTTRTFAALVGTAPRCSRCSLVVLGAILETPAQRPARAVHQQLDHRTSSSCSARSA